MQYYYREVSYSMRRSITREKWPHGAISLERNTPLLSWICRGV